MSNAACRVMALVMACSMVVQFGVGTARGAESPARYRLELGPGAGTPVQGERQPRLVADLDGDGRDEVVWTARNDSGGWNVEVRSPDDAALMSFTRLRAVFEPACIVALDVDEDGTREIVYSWLSPDSLFMDARESDCSLLARIPVAAMRDFARPGTRLDAVWDPGLAAKALLDCDGDGSAEVLCVGGAGYWGHPRGVWAMDWAHQRVLWHFAVGAKTSHLVVTEDSLGAPLIVASSYCVKNQASRNGIDDLHSYLMVLSPAGDLRRLHTLSDRYSAQTTVLSLRRRVGHQALVSLTAHGATVDPEPAILRSWSPGASRPLMEVPVEVTDTDVLTGDVDGDGSEELVLATQQGEVLVYRADLSLVGRYPVGTEKLIVVALADLDGDHRPEVVVGRGRGCAIVEPLTGEIAGFLEDHEPMGTIRHAYGEPPSVVERFYGRWSYLTVRRVSPLRLMPAVSIPWYGLAIALVICVLAGALPSGIRAAGVPHRLPGCRGTALALDRKGVLVWATSSWQTLLGQHEPAVGRPLDSTLAELRGDSQISRKTLQDRPGQWMRVTTRDPTGERHLRVRATPLAQKVSELLIEVEVIPRGPSTAIPWHAIAPRIAHNMKSPLSTLILAAQRAVRAATPVSDDGRQRELLESILRQVARIDVIARNFLKAAELEKPAKALLDTTELVGESLRALRVRVTPEVAVDGHIEPGLPLIHGDGEQLLGALENLYENAVAAVRGTGTIIVRAYRVAAMPGAEEVHRRGLAIEVSDTGCGIGPDVLDRIFEPGFSTKERGSGLGLAIVQRVVAHHDGVVEVHSEPELGTTVTLYLPGATPETQ